MMYNHGLDWLLDYIMFFLIFIVFSVMGVMMSVMSNTFIDTMMVSMPLLEFVWTVIPIVILLMLAVPSLHLLYVIEGQVESDFTIKVVAHQWYWSYEYSDFTDVEFDAYMISDYKLGDHRLLMCDNHVVVPSGSTCKFLVTSSDVLHSWAMPSMGMKMDCNPSRMNVMCATFNHMGLFFGQCSEICGANHSFMPITLEVVSYPMFKDWIQSF